VAKLYSPDCKLVKLWWSAEFNFFGHIFGWQLCWK